MRLKTLSRAGVVAIGVAVAGLSLSIPASAADVYCAAYCTTSQAAVSATYKAAVDNTETGTNVSSWIWVDSDGSTGGHADYFLNGDQTQHQLYAAAEEAETMYLPKDVTAFRVCGPNGVDGDVCSGWRHPSAG